MKTIRNLSLASTLLLLTACGAGKKEKEGILGEKKTELAQLQKQQATINEKLKTLEKEIQLLDTVGGIKENAKLVTLGVIQPEEFAHYIELQGMVEADNVAYVTPRAGGGQVKAVLVKQGDAVRKGQLLLKLDDAITKQSLAAAEQRLKELNTQIAFAKDLLERQQNLWNQGIGTEVQYLTAKNNVASLENQLKSAVENIKISREQLNTSNVYAELSGIADEVNIRVGEFFTGSPMQGIRIVNTNSLKVTTQVPESYLDKVRKGSAVLITLPDLGTTLQSSISNLGKMIDPLSRSFYVEAKIAANSQLRPNQVASVKIKDYAASNAITIPMNTLQNDEKGKFVLVAVKEGNKLVARKKQVIVGELYGDKLEIKLGLAAGDSLITDGFQGLYDGQTITTEV